MGATRGLALAGLAPLARARLGRFRRCTGPEILGGSGPKPGAGERLRPHHLTDVALYYALDNSDRVHRRWAPLFEEAAFRGVPLLLFPALFGMGIALARSLWDFRMSSAVQTILFYALVALTVYVWGWMFVRLHEYKGSERRALNRKLLSEVRRYLRGCAAGGDGFRESEHLTQVRTISGRLWALTGSEYWRPEQVLGRLRDTGVRQ